MANKKRRKEKKSAATSNPAIEAGRLRERVKAGELSAKEVLDWVRTQPDPSPDFVGWLERRISGGVTQES